MKVDNKNFYFDIGQNNRGIYMRISEVHNTLFLRRKKNPIHLFNLPRTQVKSNFRTAITVPEKCWSRFRDILTDYCDKMKKSTGGGDSSSSGASDAAAGNIANELTVVINSGAVVGGGSGGLNTLK